MSRVKKLTKSASFKLSNKEFEILSRKSKSAGMNNSEYIRKVVVHSAVDIHVVDKDFQKKILFLLSNATNNINQLAKHCNTQKQIDFATLQQLQTLSQYFKSVVKSVL